MVGDPVTITPKPLKLIRAYWGGTLQFYNAQGQAVDEHDSVGVAGNAVLVDSELANGQPVVVTWVVEVNDPGLLALNGTVIGAVLHLSMIKS